MDKKYIELFKNLAQATAATAEQVIDYDRKNNNTNGVKTAEIMYNNYTDLYNRIKLDEDNYKLIKSDAAKLAISVIILTGQLQDKIKTLQNAINGYQNEILPILNNIIDNSSSDEEAIKIAEENFIIKDNE